MSKPLYQQVITDLQLLIRKKFKANQKLPSERKLMDKYDVSRNTIRLALDDLEHRGLIYRLHGKGTFVSSIVLDQFDLGSMYSFTQEMRDLGKTPVTFNLSLELQEPKNSIQRQLNLNKGEKVYCLTRLRMVDEQPMMFEESYLPATIFPDLTMKLISKNSLYGIMRDNFQQTVVMAFEDVVAGIVTANEANILEMHDNDACLKIYRRSINDKNIPIEYTRSVARGDKFVYRTKQLNRRIRSGDDK